MANPFMNRLNGVVKSTPELEIKTSVRIAIAQQAATDRLIDGKRTPETMTAEEVQESSEHIEIGKLSKLVADDFPFDESQLAAIQGMITEDYACLTGAAGTGKTTTTKKLVDELLNQNTIGLVNMKEYFKQGDPGPDDDSYAIPDKFIPSVALVGFTGRSSQMIKKNFPRDWHGNIMTIHRLLAFIPEYYDAIDEEAGDGTYKRKMRFAPTYTADCLLPWDIIIIDEAGMVGLDLWHQLWAAMKPGTRIYMIGDINQLPPVHGRSVFGFAMSKWPSFELTHIHRQVGANNAIVDNAWRILQGQMPISDGKFQMLELKSPSGAADAQYASRLVRKMVPEFKNRGFYDPIRDSIITAINGNEGQRGYALGQLPLNQEFALIFNPSSLNPRYIIDGGRERKQFAVGDKVMATKNDYESGITNGMTGLITRIEPHPGYTGDHQRFGLVDDVNAFLNASDDSEPEEDFTLEDLDQSMEAIQDGQEAGKEKKERGPASHIVKVTFGTDDHGFDIDFATLSEVGSLMTAYVVTCHKMQGGESPTVVIICHDTHKQMMYREWLYTAVTRASQKCILLYTPQALRTALSKQSIKGTTLPEKIRAFMLLQRDNGLGASVRVLLPEAKRAVGFNQVAVYEPMPSDALVESLKGLDVQMIPADENGAPWEEEPEPTHIHLHKHIHTTVIIDTLKRPSAVFHDDVAPYESTIVQPEPRATRSGIAGILGRKMALLAPPVDQWDREVVADSAERCAERNYSWPAVDDAEGFPAIHVEPAQIHQQLKPKNPWLSKIGARQ